MRKFLALACISVTALLTACGGGGGGSSKTVETFTPAPMPMALADTSYANAKLHNIAPVTLPAGYENIDSFAVAEFKKGSNEAVLFTAKLNGANAAGVGAYSGASYFKETAAEYTFWTQTSGGWQRSSIAVGGATPCVHPRKVMVVSGNRDSQPDLIVACHGYDNYAQLGEIQGEYMQVLTSQPDGSYLVTSFGDIGYWHGAAAYSDTAHVTLVAVDNKTGKLVQYQVNRDDATYTQTVLVASGFGDKYTVEVLDVNSDGKYDAVVAGDNGLIVVSDVAGAKTSETLADSDTSNGTVVDLVVKPSATTPMVTVAKACYMASQTCGYNAATNGFTNIQKVTLGTAPSWGLTTSTTTAANGQNNWISQLVVYGNNILSANAKAGHQLSATVAH